MSADPLMLCYDGSEDAKHMIAEAGNLFPGEHALVLTVRQTISSVAAAYDWAGVSIMANFTELDHAAAEDASRMAAEGVCLAQEAGLEAEPLAVRANGPVWEAIIDAAERQQAAVVVMGSRGLNSLRSILLGGVSSTVVHHADRPTLVIHRSRADAAARRRNAPEAIGMAPADLRPTTGADGGPDIGV
jgi:nucleotide-binding universal stress UspA family protein